MRLKAGVYAIFSAISLFFVLQPFAAESSELVVAVQPLGTVEKSLVDAVKSEIQSQYKVKVELREGKSLPVEAYYPPRARYRAEKLLKFLDRTDANSDKVVGLTKVDISVTKGSYPDWGVLGYGNIGGHSCVVSTFRMSQRKVSKEVFRHRLAKVVAHELGHTFGLVHCPQKGCLMQDARGTVKTVDSENDFCTKCKQFLEPVLHGTNP